MTKTTRKNPPPISYVVVRGACRLPNVFAVCFVSHFDHIEQQGINEQISSGLQG
jgi:hypothetical protein